MARWTKAGSGTKTVIWKQATAPVSGDNPAVGDLWIDTTTNTLKYCTSASPITFAAVNSSGATLSSPLITGNILDTNGNVIIGLTATASAVDYVNITNAATGGRPTITAAGSDTNIILALTAKGAGGVLLNGSANSVTYWVNNANAALGLTHSISPLSAARTITWPDLGGVVSLDGFTTTATAAGTTTLTTASTRTQYFTGSTTQTVTLPVTSTLYTGRRFIIGNQSSGNVTVQSSGGNTLAALTNLQQLTAVCTATSGTGTASWSWVVSTLGG